MRPLLRFPLQLCTAAALIAACCAAVARAQDGAQSARAADSRPLRLALALTPEPPAAADRSPPPAPLLDAEALRTALERELAVPVELAPSADSGANTLAIHASSLRSVQVAFGTSERVVDLSSSGPHAVETLALVAANLMRDEAGDLLAELHAAATAEPPTAVPAAATELPPPAAAPQPPRTPPSEARAPRGCDPSPFHRTPLNANLVPYVGTSTLFGTEIEQTFALHLIGGAAAGLRGFELAGMFNYESDGVCGVQVGGAVNLVRGPLQGAQLSAVNWVGGRSDGAQLGFVNLTAGDLVGAQLGFLEVAGGHGRGAQLGFVDIAAGELRGAQLGFVNLTAGATRGAQTGFVNVATSDLHGAQVGFVNTAASLRGLQLGFANVTTGRARGLMLGMLNVAGDADAALGVLSIHLKGRTHLDTWLTDAGLLMLGVEHGGRLFHNIAGAGLTTRDGQGVFAFTYGLGARIHDVTPWYVDLDALAYGLITRNETTDKLNFGSILQLRAPIGYRLSPTISLFAAPALNISLAKTTDNTLHKPGLYGPRVTASDASESAYIWPGLSAGARFF